MKIPFNGNVNPSLLNRFYKDRAFYAVRRPQGEKKVFYIEHGNILIDDNFRVSVCEFVRTRGDGIASYIKTYRGCAWDDLFEDYKSAKDRAKYLNRIYFNVFDCKPHLEPSLLEQVKDTLLEVQNALHALYGQGYEVRFIDVSAGGIQVYCGDHRETIDYSGENKMQVLTGFIKHLKGIK